MNDQRYQLSITKGPEPGKVYELTSVSMTIGRDPMSEITINDPEVSRRHARFIGTLSGYRIQDLGSTNGTFVDGVRLSGEPLDLESGQVISIGGGVVLLYQALVDVDELSVTMLDVDMESEEQPPVEDQPESIIDETVDGYIDEPPPIVAEEDEVNEPEREPVLIDESAQLPDDDLPPPATVYEAPQYDEEISPLAEPANSYEADDFSEPVVISHKGEPAQPPQPEQGTNYRRLSTIVVAVLLLIICCCCSMSLFLYYYGGDWLLRQMGLLP